MPRAAQLEPAVRRRCAGSTPSTSSENRARACSTSSSVAASTVRCRSSARAAERIGQRQQDAADLLGLLLLERDDVVVDLDGAQRLEEQARAARRAAVDDAGNRAAVLGADDEHVAAVAVGDDLLLQVLRRVLAAQVRLERAAQPRPLLAQPIADAPQLRARVVDDLAGGIDLAADVGDLALERRGRCRRWRAGAGKRCARAADRGARRRRPRRGSRRAPRSCSGSSARPSTASDVERSRRVRPAPAGATRVLGEEPHGFRRRSERGRDAPRVGQRLQRGQPRRARRRLREAADGLDDAIEFEGPQGAGCMVMRGSVDRDRAIAQV